jgi:hypothetical protein
MMTITEMVVICNFLVVNYSVHGEEDGRAHEVCMEVAREAQAQNAPEDLMVAVAYHESRMDPEAHNRRTGAHGVLQVIERWHCIERDLETLVRSRHSSGEYVRIPPEECPLLRMGVMALRSYFLERDSWEWALARYNGGRHPGSRAHTYAREVLETRDSLRDYLDMIFDYLGRPWRSTDLLDLDEVCSRRD